MRETSFTFQKDLSYQLFCALLKTVGWSKDFVMTLLTDSYKYNDRTSVGNTFLLVLSPEIVYDGRKRNVLRP